ncbi:MAG TPA: ATP-binding cassette domain-containing protein [Thermoanaerobaculia bacterium]|nr:ATP-binding cassette domain-containing protein [Thermoanaerobaculia bacterium]
MLDVAAVVEGVTLVFPKSTHTAVIGPPACGASTLLRVLAGDARGTVRIGARDVSALRRSRRPLLYVTSSLDAPERWSVRYLLIAAVRARSLDREDRHHEFELAAEKWKLSFLLDRRLGTLSSTERTRANLARIELLKPAILVADRLLELANPSTVATLADDIARTLRVAGTTVISAPASPVELGLCDRVVVLDQGRVAQVGVPSEVFAAPQSAAAAMATGDVNVIPIEIRGRSVTSAIGTWEADAPFQGSGVALARPDDFAIAAKGEDSDLIFGIEEASFRDGRWHLYGLLTGGLILHVVVPREVDVHKGKLLALRYDPARFSLKVRGLQSDAS